MQKRRNLNKLEAKFKAEGGLGEAVDNSLLRVPSGVVIDKMGAQFPEEMPIESWIEFGRQHRDASETMIWVLIDWMRHGMGAYGERYKWAIEQTGYSYSYLTNLVSVDNRITARQENLTFSHHAVVAPLPANDQSKIMSQAVEGQWSVERARQEVNKIKNPSQPLESHDEIKKVNRSLSYLGRVSISEIEQMTPDEREVLRDKIAKLISVANGLMKTR